jgi:hypothetical protein
MTIVDDKDYVHLNQWKWHAKTNGSKWYACRFDPKPMHKSVRMHRYILGITDDGIQTDHINGDSLDNRRKNLRQCMPNENQKNKKKMRRVGNSQFKGVFRNGPKYIKPWRAMIISDGRIKHLGSYLTEEEAARAYDSAATVLHREFSNLNFPNQRHQDPNSHAHS